MLDMLHLSHKRKWILDDVAIFDNAVTTSSFCGIGPLPLIPHYANGFSLDSKDSIVKWKTSKNQRIIYWGPKALFFAIVSMSQSLSHLMLKLFIYFGVKIYFAMLSLHSLSYYLPKMCLKRYLVLLFWKVFIYRFAPIMYISYWVVL